MLLIPNTIREEFSLMLLYPKQIYTNNARKCNVNTAPQLVEW